MHRLFLLIFLIAPIAQGQSENDPIRILTAKIIAAENATQRNRLLQENPDLIDLRLRDALIPEMESLVKKGQYEKSLSICDLIDQITARSGDEKDLSVSLNARALVLRSQERFPEALSLLQRSLELSKKFDDQKTTSATLYNIGMTYQEQGNYTASISAFQEGMVLAQARNDQKTIARVLNGLSRSYYRISENAQAMAAANRSLAISTELGDEIGIAESYISIANLLGREGKHDLELEKLGMAQRICEKFGDQIMLAQIFNNTANALHSRGDYSQALEYHTRALQIRELSQRKTLVAMSLINIGIIHEYQGNYDLALEFYQRALALSKSVGNKFLAALSTSNSAGMLAIKKDFRRALQGYLEALTLYDAIGRKDPPGTLYSIGEIYEKQGNYSTALRYYEKSEKRRREQNEIDGLPEVWLGLSRVYGALKKYDLALKFAKKAEPVARETKQPEYLLLLQTQEGHIYKDLGKTAEAAKQFEAAIQTIEDLRLKVAGEEIAREQYFESRTEPYYEMIDLLIGQNQTSRAFSYMERAKARALFDVLQSGKVDVSEQMSAEEKSEEERLVARLTKLNAELKDETASGKSRSSRLEELERDINKARFALESFHATLYAAHPELWIQRGEAQITDIKEIESMIGISDALIEFAVGENKTFLFVITRGGQPDSRPLLRIVTIPLSHDELARRTINFRKQLADRSLRYAPLAKQLYSVLLAPAEKWLAGKNRIIIVPDRELWELPFQALQFPSGEFLLQKFALSYTPSLSVLRAMKNAGSNASKSLLAFGNPNISSQAVLQAKTGQLRNEFLSPLPEAEAEVQTLGKLYGSGSQIYIGEAARESVLKSNAARFGILHVAAHGVLSDEHPMYSHLLLAANEKQDSEDGLLEPWEIMKLKLNASLVVLSACETALGKIGRGEGMIGFAWAFFVAGAPSTVVSQWKVDSHSTTQLMVEFHRLLTDRSQSMSKVDALRLAALSLLKNPQYSHPFYWAGFVLVGNPS